MSLFPDTLRENIMKPASISPALISPSVQKTSNQLAPAKKSFSSLMKAKTNEPTAGQEITKRIGAFVDRVESDRAALDNTLHASARGRDLEPAQLLRVQALMYDYSQRVELASKVVSSATSGIKQVLNTQV